MNRWTRLSAIGILVTLVAGMLTQQPAHADWQTLSNGFLPAFTSAVSYQISPDSKLVAYIADSITDEVPELFLASLTGRVPRKLNPQLVAGGGVKSFQFTPDSTAIVYLAEQEVDNQVEMYRVPVASGSAVKVNPPLVAGGNVQSFKIDGKNGRIVYVADQQTNEVFELWSIPISGGSAVKLSGTMVSGGDVGPYELDQLSNRVVYNADENIDGTYELFSVPVNGGAPRIKLNDTIKLQGGGDSGIYGDFAVNPIAPVVVFIQNLPDHSKSGVYMIPTAGGATTQLSFDLLTTQRILWFRISPTGDRVVFNVGTRQGSTNAFMGNLYSTLIGGGGNANLTETADPTYGVGAYDFQFTPDGTRVVYKFQKTSADVPRLESSVVQTGVRATLFQPGSSDPPVLYFRLSNDSQWVLYLRGTSFTDYRAYTVPPGGGNPVGLGRAYEPVIFPDSSRVAYSLIGGANNYSDVRSAQIFGGSVRDISGTDLTGYVGNLQIAPDSKHIVFTFMQSDGRIDLRVSDGAAAQPTPTATQPTPPAPITSPTTTFTQSIPGVYVNGPLTQ